MNGFTLDIPQDKTPVYPIYLLDNQCLHCGKKGTLSFVDKFGNWSKEEVFDIYRMGCTKCHTVFDIIWKQQEDGKYKPICTEKSVTHLYTGYLRQSSDK